MQLNSASLPCTLQLHYSTQKSTKTFSKLKPSRKPSPFTSHPNHRRSKFNTLHKPFLEEDVFPSSLPLHTKNPHAVCKAVQRFARQNKLKEALTILDYMDHKGIPVNITTFSALIAACIRTKSLSEGKQIHTHIRINGLENNEFLKTKLVHMYTSCASFEDAHQLFGTIPVKSVYPYNALLRGNVVSGRRRYGDVVDTFMEMRESGIECNEYSFSCLIKSFAGASALRQGLKAHALLIKNGFIDSCMLMTSLIDMYFKCGKIALACKVFEEMDERDVVVWGAMLAGFAHNRLQREALDYLRWMIWEGVCPNSVILTTILAVIGDVRAIKLGREVHAYVLKTKSYMKQLTIQSALIDMYCKCGNMASGRQVFYSSIERNAISWTALMSGYITNGRLEQALRCTVWMQQEGFRPDAVTIATVLPVCTELRALKHGKEIHAYALKNDMFPNISIVTCLMVMYSKCGIINYSSKLFECMSYRNVIAWTAMIDSYAENGCLGEAIGVFRSMQLSKHRPDSVAVARILNVCAKLKALRLGKVHYIITKSSSFFSKALSQLAMAGTVVVFDFDKTIIDCDSDNWVLDDFGLTNMFNELLPTIPWNTLMDKMMNELHSKGKNIEQIAEVLRRAPIHPSIVPAIKAAHALGCDLRILSDANMFYIETILEHLGIRECFSEINTNPGFVDGEGRLRILPYHDFKKAPHGCSLCPPNMCKGLVIERIQDSLSEEDNKRFIYLGDGAGDYCPSLKLKETDFMMPRKNFPVWDLIRRDPMLVKAEIREWTDGEELEQNLLQIIDTIRIEDDGDSNQLISSSDCKLQSFSASAHEALRPALPVPQ